MYKLKFASCKVSILLNCKVIKIGNALELYYFHFNIGNLQK